MSSSEFTHKRSVTGFTLLEVMAALVIVSLGMLAVIQAVSQTANNNAYLRDKTIAHWVAMNRITEVRLAPQAPTEGESSGEVEMAGRRWRWTTQVTPTAVQSMRRIDVGVSEIVGGLDTGEPRQLAFLSGFYGTKIAQPGLVKAQFDAAPTVPTPGGGSTSSSSGGPSPGGSTSSGSSSGGTTSSGGSSSGAPNPGS